MSSGLQADPDAARAAVMSADEFGESGTKYLKLTERQKELNEYWAYYKVAEHDAKGTDWAGRPLMRREMRDMISRQRYIPPGFVDAGGDTLPMDFRRPAAPLGIIRTVVSRFTGLLFSHKRHPQLAVPGDHRTEDYVNGLLEYGNFWSTAMLFRNQGGAMGSACFGFKFVNSNCVFEAIDPRWCEPEFVGQGYQELSKLTIQYTYAKEEYDEKTEKHKKVWYWYRRVIDTMTDTLWVPVKCKEHGKEPPWDYIKKNTIEHGFGEVPYEWVQNTQSDDDVDGDPDAVGCYDMVRTVDQLLSEVWSGTIGNCVGSETQFITRTGVRAFTECAVGEQLTVLTHTGAWKPATVKSYGEQQLYNVVFGRGANEQSVRATAGHRWLLADGRTVTTSELSIKDKILKPPHLIRDWCYEEASEEQKLAWAQGFAYGDGCVMQNNGKIYGSKIRLCGHKARFLGRFEALGCSVTYPPSSDGEPTVYFKGYDKQLPDPAATSHENMMAFVRGYLDADGSRNLKHPEAADINPFQGIQATGQETIEFIRRVFPSVGAYIVNEDDRTDQPTNYGVRSEQTVYFSLVLGFSNSPVAPYNVRRINVDAVESVWCLEVEDDHSFVLPCGIVTLNCDPTLTLVTDMELNAIKKGSDNAIRLNAGSSAQYLELGGNGPRVGLEVAKAIEERIFRLAQCVPDNVLYESNGEKTATEIERIFSSMLEKADMLRAQYGPAIVHMCEKLIRAAKMITTVRELEDGRLVRGKINVPPRTVSQADGDVVELPRVVGDGTSCVISWPPYYRASFTDIQTAVNMSTQAKDAEVLTKESVIRYIAPLMGIDPLKEIIALKKAADAAQEAEAASAEEEPEEEAPEKPDAAAWKAALETGLCTINEYRENVLSLGALPDGDLTLPQYRASHAELFVAATAVMSPQAANQAVNPQNPEEKELQAKRVRDELSGKVPTGTPAPSGSGSKAPEKAAKGTRPERAASDTSK